MRSPDNDSGRRTPHDGTIPSVKVAFEGLLGIKAPAGYKQESDIKDRLHSAGILKMVGTELKR